MLYSFRYDGITLIEEMLNVENHLCKSRSTVCKLKRNCCLIFNFVLEHMYNVSYLKEGNFFVKGAKIWSNMKISSCHCFYYFREVYGRIAPSYGKRKKVCQTYNINFCTKLKIYLNKCWEKNYFLMSLTAN